MHVFFKIDNALIHNVDCVHVNKVKFHLLPLNTTAKFQPMINVYSPLLKDVIGVTIVNTFWITENGYISVIYTKLNRLQPCAGLFLS